ncbi:MAG: hypothetical protein AB1540_02220 [Bdellovibrionota bacterium]
MKPQSLEKAKTGGSCQWRRGQWVALIAGLFFTSLSLNAYGSTGETYGYGSRASALGNTMLGGTSDAFATFYNPAANSSHPGLHISLGTSFAHPEFLEIKNVVIGNTATLPQQNPTTGDVDTESYLDHLSQVVGISFNLGEKLKNLTLGALASMPLARIAYLDTGEPFKPEYFNYRSRTQRPQVYAAMSVSPLKTLHLGTGVAFATHLSANVDAVITSADGSVSYQRFASTIKPTASPYFSIFADPQPWQVGITARLPSKNELSVDTNARARLLGNTNDLPLRMNSSSAIFYDPLEIDLAVGFQATEATWITVEADWFNYKAFEQPTLTVTDLGSVTRLNASVSTLPTMRNILVPKAGLEQSFGAVKGRLGYAWRPSPVADNSGAGNLVDPEKHIFGVGFGFDLQKLGVTEKEIFLDLHGQYHHLVKQHITKSPGNEAGNSSQPKVGSPGYDIGGAIYGAGFSLSTRF